jgi:hypothetical protein
MINLELLTEFTHEDLRYKSVIKVVSYRINVKHLYAFIPCSWIELQFQNGMGEVVKLERYYNWLQSSREEKINQIL